MITLQDIAFGDLSIGEKFETYDTAAVFEKKDAKQAYCPSFAPAGWFHFYSDEIVRAFPGTDILTGAYENA